MPEVLTETKAAGYSKTRPPMRGGEDTFTTGQIARFCRVAPRTVSKWIDSGKLKGYRVPCAADRRVTRTDLEAFLSENGMPRLEPREGDGPVLLVGFTHEGAERVREAVRGRRDVLAFRNVFQAGMAAHQYRVSAVVVDGSVGSIEARSVAAGVRSGLGESVRVGLVGSPEDGAAMAFDEVMPLEAVHLWAVAR